MIRAWKSYFFLNLKGDTSNGTLLDSLHQVSSETSNFISHSLGGDNSDFTKDLLVEMEVIGQLVVVLFDQLLGSSLGGLSSNSSLYKELVWLRMKVNLPFLFVLDLSFVYD